MTRRFLASGVLLLGMLAVPARAAQDNVLLYPPDLTLSLEEKVKVFGYLPEKGIPDNVTVNGIPAAPLEGETFPKGEAKLFPGLNVLRVGDKQVRLFFLPDVKLPHFRLPAGKEGEDLVGDDWVEGVGAHIMVLVPDVETLNNLSTDSKNGGPWVMWANTPYAHLMIPIDSYPSQ